MYIVYNRFTAVEQGTYDDWTTAHDMVLALNADRYDSDPYALRLNA